MCCLLHLLHHVLPFPCLLRHGPVWYGAQLLLSKWVWWITAVDSRLASIQCILFTLYLATSRGEKHEVSLWLFLSCWMDPYACEDGGGHRNRLLLHNRPADPGSRRLLHQRLALAHTGCLSAFLCVLPLLMVSLLLMVVSTKQTVFLCKPL